MHAKGRPEGWKARRDDPLDTRCDFCGRAFRAVAWNQRTCIACAVEGAPDQSKGEWGPYERAAADWSREHGGRPALTGRAALRIPPVHRKQPAARP